MDYNEDPEPPNRQRDEWMNYAKELKARVEKLESALLAIAAEDWNDEDQPLVDDKPQGIGPGARARRVLGIQAFDEARRRRALAVPTEFRSKRLTALLQELGIA